MFAFSSTLSFLFGMATELYESCVRFMVRRDTQFVWRRAKRGITRGLRYCYCIQTRLGTLLSTVVDSEAAIYVLIKDTLQSQWNVYAPVCLAYRYVILCMCSSDEVNPLQCLQLQPHTLHHHQTSPHNHRPPCSPHASSAAVSAPQCSPLGSASPPLSSSHRCSNVPCVSTPLLPAPARKTGLSHNTNPKREHPLSNVMVD